MDSHAGCFGGRSQKRPRLTDLPTVVNSQDARLAFGFQLASPSPSMIPAELNRFSSWSILSDVVFALFEPLIPKTNPINPKLIPIIPKTKPTVSIIYLLERVVNRTRCRRATLACKERAINNCSIVRLSRPREAGIDGRDLERGPKNTAAIDRPFLSAHY